MAAKFELKKGRTGKFSFSLKATNGQVILSSETYPDRRSANKGIQSVQRNAANPKRYEIRTAKNQEQYFVLKAGNGEIIGMSERYKTTRSLNAGIASVQKNGATDAIVDLTEPQAKAPKASTSKQAVKAQKASSVTKPKRTTKAKASTAQAEETQSANETPLASSSLGTADPAEA